MGVVGQPPRGTAVAEYFGDIGGSKAGTSAFRLKYTNAAGAYKLEWEEDRGIVVLRHFEQKYDALGALKTDSYYTPSKVRLDMQPAHLVVGASYTEVYTVADTPAGSPTVTSTHTVNWRVENLDEVITVPAGAFHCLRLRRYSTGGGTTPSDKTYWFSQGVGKVKVDEPGVATEELTSYTLVP